LYSVSLFKTGEECLKHLDLKPDVVILDYTLNSVVRSAADGLEILQEIRRSVPNVHVIMLSSQDDYARALETIVKGAIEYVVKNNDAFSRIDHILAG
jgi:DNA-binding NarL/FixJ family response regulator